MNADRTPPRALSHPLPAGLRDLLPEETQRRRAIARTILEHFALHTYDLVTPPAFELAEVLEKGLGTLDPGDVLRFVEPESGEVCALRPDMTPQIARMVATRLSGQPIPIRLCYEGTIVRRKQGRARRHRQIPQAGVELYGAPSPSGDIEVLRLLASVSRSVGLESFVIDVGHGVISRSLIEVLPESVRPEITDALVHKDSARLETLLSSKDAANVTTHVARAIVALPELSGGFTGRPGSDVIRAAEKLFAATPAEGPLREVSALWEMARSSGRVNAGGPNDELGDVLRIDLGEVRHLAYYTGLIFNAVAPGPGEAFASGGRYDDLLGRFGHPMAAVGFALHLDAVIRAREAAGVAENRPVRVLVALGAQGETLARELRGKGIATGEAGGVGNAMEYAKAHRFTHVVLDGPQGGEDVGVVGVDDEGVGAVVPVGGVVDYVVG